MLNRQTQLSSSNSAQPSFGPIAQQLQKIQSSCQQLPQKSTQQAAINLPPNKRSGQPKSADKTLWNWLDLIAKLLVPLMIAAFTIITTIQQNQLSQQQIRNNFEVSKQQHNGDQEIADNQQQAAMLKAYFGDITDLMLNHGLLQSKSGDEVRITARTDTLIALQVLNGDRKGALIQFLYETKLIGGSQFNGNSVSLYDPIVYLVGANLSNANLSKAFLIVPSLNYGHLAKGAIGDPRGVVLAGIDLSGVDLSTANFNRVDLSEANLEGAKVTPEQLEVAYSLMGVRLPDGSTYPSQSYPIPYGP